ncbi:hypothetical protein ACNKHR_28830 [Shigella flexneri]
MVYVMRMRQKSAYVEAVREMLKNHPAIDQRQTLLVYFNQFADSSLILWFIAFQNHGMG